MRNDGCKVVQLKDCPYCGHAHDAADQYCPNCGREFIKITCRRCGKELGNPNLAYCPHCGIRKPLSLATEHKLAAIAARPAKGDTEGNAIVFTFLAFVSLLIFAVT